MTDTPRATESIAADIDGVEVDRAAAAGRLEQLQTEWNAVLLAGDDKRAERHEAAMAKERRAVQRFDLRIPILKEELAAGLAAEQAAALAERQAAAKQQVDALIARASEYRDAAKTIARFLSDWKEVTDMASTAGVSTPHEHLRFEPGAVIPAHQIEEHVYLDEAGSETSSPFAAGSYRLDAEGRRLDRLGQPLAERKQRKKVRTVPERQQPSRNLPQLPATVALPALALGEPDFWKGESLVVAPKKQGAMFGQFAA
jgi:hypothetical protein